MSIPGSASPLFFGAGAAEAAAFTLQKSVRFNVADTPELTRTPSSAGNTSKFTISFWAKRSKLGSTQMPIQTGDTYANLFRVYWDGNDNFVFHQYNGSSYVMNYITSARHRDTSAWYHYVIAIDTTLATAADRARLYVNGVEVTDWLTESNPAQNLTTGWNAAIKQRIGREYTTTYGNYYNYGGYLADFYNIDGQQLDCTSFGEFDDNGVWQAKDASGLTFGTNGFHLFDFASESGIGNDSSGNDNDFNVSNLTNKDVQAFDGVAFDGNGDYLSLASSSDFGFGTGDFTIEAFVLSNTNSNTPYILDGRSTLSASENVPTLYINSNNFEYWVNGSARITAGNSTAGTWRHVAVVRDGSTTTMYVDGTSAGTFSDSINYATCPLIIGQRKNGSSQSLEGFISNLRIVKGTAVYTANFTVPTAPLSNVTNTTLLCCQSSSSATAKTVGGTITANGNVFAGTFSDTSADIDVLRDVPTNGDSSDDTGAGGEVSGNYPTWNTLNKTASTFSNGNLQVTTPGSTGYELEIVNFYTPAGTGKWYWEFELDALTGNNYTMVGMIPTDHTYKGGASNIPTEVGGLYVYIGSNGSVLAASGAATAGTATATFGVGDILGWAFDAENGTVKCYKNGVAQGTQFTNVRTDVGWAFCATDYDNSAAATYVINYGQRAFVYAAPSGYKCLNTASLPTPTIADGSDYFDVVLRTADTTQSKSVTSLAFSPDLVWEKVRSHTSSHYLADSVRGSTKTLSSNTSSAEATYSTFYTSFNSDGYTIGTGDFATGRTVVGWAWDAGSSTVSNTDGSITSSVRANQTAGFSIVSYTGTGTANDSVGHGLNAAPELIITKNRDDSTYSWRVLTTAVDGSLDRLFLNATSTKADQSGVNVPTSSVFYVGSNLDHNKSGDAIIAYCISPVAGYSAVGSYKGNANADGPMVALTFRPAFILTKGIDDGEDWYIRDTARSPFNVVNESLRPNDTGSEYSGRKIDILSNGFKIRDSDSQINENNKSYLYYAVAENPFQANGGLAR